LTRSLASAAIMALIVAGYRPLRAQPPSVTVRPRSARRAKPEAGSTRGWPSTVPARSCWRGPKVRPGHAGARSHGGSSDPPSST